MEVSVGRATPGLRGTMFPWIHNNVITTLLSALTETLLPSNMHMASCWNTPKAFRTSQALTYSEQAICAGLLFLSCYFPPPKNF